MWNRHVSDWPSHRTRSFATAFVSMALALFAAPLVAQTGTVTGRVVDSRSGVPITTAQITITGTSLGAAVDADGRFRIVNVPQGAHEV